MKTKHILSVIVTLVLVAPSLAQIPGQFRPPMIPVKIKKIVIVGSGIAIDTENLDSFSFVRLIVGRVWVKVNNETLDVSRGIMFVDDTKYVLNITRTNDTVEAKIYYNDTEVGELSTYSVLKGNRVVWVGDITIDSAKLKVYIIEHPRVFKPQEIKEKVKEFCERHPERCKGIGPNYCDKLEDKDCREKIVEWCKENIDDARCRALAQQVGKILPNYPELHQIREKLQERTQATRYCALHPDECIPKPIIERIRERLKIRGG